MNPIKDKIAYAAETGEIKSSLSLKKSKRENRDFIIKLSGQTDEKLDIKPVDTDAIYEKLIAKIRSYNPQMDVALLDKAYSIAKKHHENQYRKSGEPFVVHPLEVANILANIELDQTSIIAALLHDLIEDTSVTAVQAYGTRVVC